MLYWIVLVVLLIIAVAICCNCLIALIKSCQREREGRNVHRNSEYSEGVDACCDCGDTVATADLRTTDIDRGQSTYIKSTSINRSSYNYNAPNSRPFNGGATRYESSFAKSAHYNNGRMNYAAV